MYDIKYDSVSAAGAPTMRALYDYGCSHMCRRAACPGAARAVPLPEVRGAGAVLSFLSLAHLYTYAKRPNNKSLYSIIKSLIRYRKANNQRIKDKKLREPIPRHGRRKPFIRNGNRIIPE